MRILHAVLAGAVLAVGFGAMPAGAQVQLNVCGVPPLPPCGPPPGYYGRPPPPGYYDDGERDFGRLCRTRYERCRVPPRPIGARCVCEDEDGEEVMGRIVR